MTMFRQCCTLSPHCQTLAELDNDALIRFTHSNLLALRFAAYLGGGDLRGTEDETMSELRDSFGHIITPTFRCFVREECWRDLNARAIAAGTGKTTRQFACGFEVVGTVAGCKRQTRYIAPGQEAKQQTMSLS